MIASYFHDDAHGLSDPLGRGLDVAVREMSVTHCHLHVGVTEQAGNHRHRHAVHDRMARHRMTKVVKANVFDAGFAAHAIPERQVGTARAGGIARRGEHERTLAARLPVENRARLCVERDRPRPRLAVRKRQHVIVNLGPSQADDLALAASGQQQEADDVGLLGRALPGLAIQNEMEAGDFLAGQEPGECRDGGFF